MCWKPCLRKHTHTHKNKPWFVAFANVCGVNTPAQPISRSQCAAAELASSGGTHTPCSHMPLLPGLVCNIPHTLSCLSGLGNVCRFFKGQSPGFRPTWGLLSRGHVYWTGGLWGPFPPTGAAPTGGGRGTSPWSRCLISASTSFCPLHQVPETPGTGQTRPGRVGLTVEWMERHPESLSGTAPRGFPGPDLEGNSWETLRGNIPALTLGVGVHGERGPGGRAAGRAVCSGRPELVGRPWESQISPETRPL